MFWLASAKLIALEAKVSSSLLSSVERRLQRKVSFFVRILDVDLTDGRTILLNLSGILIDEGFCYSAANLSWKKTNCASAISLSVPKCCNFTTNFGSILFNDVTIFPHELFRHCRHGYIPYIYICIVDFEVVGTLIRRSLSQ